MWPLEEVHATRLLLIGCGAFVARGSVPEEVRGTTHPFHMCVHNVRVFAAEAVMLLRHMRLSPNRYGVVADDRRVTALQHTGGCSPCVHVLHAKCIS